MSVRTYQILDVGLTLDAPPGPFLETFHQDYGRFEVQAPPQGHPMKVRFQAGACLELDGAREALAGHPEPDRFGAQVLARALMERVEAYTILHAAVLGSPEGLLALSGPSGAGKTTLALALMAEGWAYYSDDFCPIHRATRLVHPFPRSLWVRQEEGLPGRAGKVLAPLEARGFKVGRAPRGLTWLICLGGEAVPGGLKGLRVDLREGQGDALLAALRGLAGVALQAEDAWRWTLRYPPERTRELLALLDAHRGACWNVFTLPGEPLDFTAEPSLTPMAHHEAAFFLLRELKHRPLGTGLRPGALLAHLGDLLAPVACFRLTPGPLDRCLTLIHDTLKGREAS